MGLLTGFFKNITAFSYEKGTRLLEEGQIREAMNVFKAMLQRSPNDFRAHAGLAMAYAMAGNEWMTHLHAEILAQTRPDLARKAVERAAEVSPSDLPMYGPQGLPENLVEANSRFVEEIIQMAGQRDKAAARGIALGWEALNAGDLRTGMHRFNQAWLLTPDDPVVFWGFGCVSSEQSRHDQALVMMERANEKLSGNGYFLCDFGRVHMKKAEESLDPASVRESLEEAGGLFQKASDLEPTWPMTYLQWGIALARSFDFTAARDKFLALGRLGEPVEEVLKALDLGVTLQTKGVEGIGTKGNDVLTIILRECEARFARSLWASVKWRLPVGPDSMN